MNGEIKNTQAQLKDVEKLLKLDPSNTELLSQKQRLLNEAVEETKEKLDALKNASEQAIAALGIEITNTDGTFKSLDEIIAILRTSFTGLTDEEKAYYAAALVAAFIYLWDNCDGFRQFWIDLWEKIKEVFNKIKEFITGFAKNAFKWGKDLVMGLVNGIKNWIGAVGDAVKSVADKIKSFLHFSVPDEGPLTEYESWMPDFMKGLAKGIEKSKGLVADAVDGLAADMVINPRISGMESFGAVAEANRLASLDGMNSIVKNGNFPLQEFVPFVERYMMSIVLEMWFYAGELGADIGNPSPDFAIFMNVDRISLLENIKERFGITE